MDPNCPVLESHSSSMESPKTDYVEQYDPKSPPLAPQYEYDAYQSQHDIQQSTAPAPASRETVPAKMDWLAKMDAFGWYRAWYALRWKLASRVFSKPIPVLTASFDVKLGDVILLLPAAGGLVAWCAALLAGLQTGGSGTPASIAIALTFALSVRNNSLLLALTGLSFERAIFYHKVFGFVSFVTASMHGLSYLLKHHQVYGGSNSDRVFEQQDYDDANADVVVSGAVAYFSLALLFLLSFYVLRRKFFEFFVRVHWILFIVIVVGSLLHGAGLVAVGAGVWAIDMLYRLVYQTRVYKQGSYFASSKAADKPGQDDNVDRPSAPQGQRRGVAAPSQVSLSKVSSDVVCIRFPKIRADTGECFHYEAGQFAFLCIPGVAWLEWHPFSISSAPHERFVTFHVRTLGDWTKKLLKLAESHASGGNNSGANTEPFQLELLVDGPYGNVALDIATPAAYSHFALFCGGIGVTPMKSVVNQLHYEFAHLNRVELQRIHFVWSVRDPGMLDALAGASNASQDDDGDNVGASVNQHPAGPFGRYGLHHLSNETASSSHPDAVFKTEIYLSRSERDVERQLDSVLERSMRYNSRPNAIEILRAIGQDAQKHKKTRVAVLVCGPAAMVKDVVNASMQLTREMKVHFDVHSEKFEF